MNISFVLLDITTRGGVERITSILANSLSDIGFNVTIISIFKRYELPAFCINDKVSLIYATLDDYNLKKSRIKLIPMQFKALFKLKKILSKIQSNLIIAQCFMPALYLYLLGYSSISLVCDHFKYELYNKFIRSIRDYIYSKFRKVVVLTDSDRKKYELKIRNVLVIPNISPFTVGNKSNLMAKRIIAVGRLSYQKGFDLLLKSVKDLFNDYPDWILDIYGEGELLNELIQIRNSYGLDSHVFFRGYVANIQDELLNSSIFVLSSRYEGLPMVLLEAMSCSLPIVSFKCPEGPADLLKDDIGVLVDPEDIVGLKNALSQLMGHYSLREKYAINEYNAALNYTPENVLKKWIYLFKNLGLIP